ATWAARPGVVRDGNSTLGNTVTAAGLLSGVLVPVLDILRNIGAVGSGFLPGLAGGLATAAQRAAEFVSNARASGQLGEWMQTGMATLAQLAGILLQLGRIVTSVFSAAQASGGNFLSTLSTLLGTVAAFLSSGA